MFSSIKRILGCVTKHLDDIIEALEFSVEVLNFIKAALRDRAFP